MGEVRAIMRVAGPVPDQVLLAAERALSPRLGTLEDDRLARAVSLADRFVEETDVYLLHNMSTQGARKFLSGEHANLGGPADAYRTRIEIALGIHARSADRSTVYATPVFTETPWRPSGFDDAATGANYGPIGFRLREDAQWRATFTPYESVAIQPYHATGGATSDDWPMPRGQLGRVVVGALEHMTDRWWPRVRWDAQDETVIHDIRRRMTSSLASSGLIEAQVHGGVRASDVAEVRARLRAWNTEDVRAGARTLGIPARRISADPLPFDWSAPAARTPAWQLDR